MNNKKAKTKHYSVHCPFNHSKHGLLTLAKEKPRTVKKTITTCV